MHAQGAKSHPFGFAQGRLWRKERRQGWGIPLSWVVGGPYYYAIYRRF